MKRKGLAGAAAVLALCAGKGPTRKTLLAACVPLCLLLAPSVASATWGRVNCGANAEGSNHCYSLARWAPNVHKNVNNVWAYVTPEDVRFGHPTGPREFITMEMWDSWSEPGRIVEYVPPGEAEAWIETGEIWTSSGCYYFLTINAPYAKEGLWHVSEEEQACNPRVHALFKVQKESTGEWCVYWNKNEVWCFDVGEFPNVPFTRLNSGMEIATEYKPTGVKGFVEAFAQGGVNNWWEGKYKARYLYTLSHATCTYVHSPGPGSVGFMSGAECTENYEPPEAGVKWQGDEPEEPRAAKVKGTSETEDVSEEPPPPLSEETFSLPESSGPGPVSRTDTWANYAPKGLRAKVKDKEAALSEMAEIGVKPEAVEVATASAPLNATGVTPGHVPAASSPNQDLSNKAISNVIEVEHKPQLEAYRENGEIKVREGINYMYAPGVPTPAEYGPPMAENISFIYNKAGKLVGEAWGKETARQKQRTALRRELFKLHAEFDHWLGKKTCERWVEEKSNSYKTCEVELARDKAFRERLKREKLEATARKKAEKKQARLELNEEKLYRKEHGLAKAASLPPKGNPNKFAESERAREVTEVAAPEKTSVIAIRHGRNVVHVHRGHRYLLRLHEGRRYTFTARGPGYRCVKRARFSGEPVRLGWLEGDCTRN